METTNYARASGLVLFVIATGCGPGPVGPGESPAVYHVLGLVADQDAHPLADAVVTIMDGPLVGTSAVTNAEGKFELRGGRGVVSIRAGREGFQTLTQTAGWEPLGFGRDDVIGIRFFLQGSSDPPLLEPGLYTLTVTADLASARDHGNRPNAPCAGFPRELASRTYQAEIKGHSVTAEDPTLRWHDLLSFYISASYVRFEMEGEVGGGIYEDLPGFRYLQIGGSSNAQPAVRSGSSVAISFTGAIAYCQLKSAILNDDCSLAPADQIVEAHVCVADRNTLVFTKR